MSCLHFTTSAQQAQIAAGGMDTPLRWTMPVRTRAKVRRLDQLAASDKIDFRVSAAGNPMTALPTLVRLAVDAEPRVRGWVARNPAVSDTMLHTMSVTDPDDSIRAYCVWLLQRRAESGIIKP